MENVQFFNTAKIQGLIIHGERSVRGWMHRHSALRLTKGRNARADEAVDDDEELIDGDDMGEERVEEIVDCGTPSQVGLHLCSFLSAKTRAGSWMMLHLQTRDTCAVVTDFAASPRAWRTKGRSGTEVRQDHRRAGGDDGESARLFVHARSLPFWLALALLGALSGKDSSNRLPLP